MDTSRVSSYNASWISFMTVLTSSGADKQQISILCKGSVGFYYMNASHLCEVAGWCPVFKLTTQSDGTIILDSMNFLTGILYMDPVLINPYLVMILLNIRECNTKMDLVTSTVSGGSNKDKEFLIHDDVHVSIIYSGFYVITRMMK